MQSITTTLISVLISLTALFPVRATADEVKVTPKVRRKFTVVRIRFQGRNLTAYQSNGKAIWHKSFTNEIIDGMIGWRGFIYLSLGDGNLAALNQNGQHVWTHSLSGSSNYFQIVRYGKDGFVALNNNSIYRLKFGDPSFPDAIQYFQRHHVVWDKAFPANARLRVTGRKIYAVFFRHHRKIVWRIF